MVQSYYGTVNFPNVEMLHSVCHVTSRFLFLCCPYMNSFHSINHIQHFLHEITADGNHPLDSHGISSPRMMMRTTKNSPPARHRGDGNEEEEYWTIAHQVLTRRRRKRVFEHPRQSIAYWCVSASPMWSSMAKLELSNRNPMPSKIRNKKIFARFLIQLLAFAIYLPKPCSPSHLKWYISHLPSRGRLEPVQSIQRSHN